MVPKAPVASWHSGLPISSGVATVVGLQSQPGCTSTPFSSSLQSRGCSRSKMHAYCRSSLWTTFHSWPLTELAPTAAPGGASASPVAGLVPVRGFIDSRMSGSSDGVLPSALGRIMSQPVGAPSTPPSAMSELFLKPPLARLLGSRAMSCQGTPTMPAKKTRLLARCAAAPSDVSRSE
jgi:hypothetical protein